MEARSDSQWRPRITVEVGKQVHLRHQMFGGISLRGLGCDHNATDTRQKRAKRGTNLGHSRPFYVY